MLETKQVRDDQEAEALKQQYKEAKEKADEEREINEKREQEIAKLKKEIEENKAKYEEIKQEEDDLIKKAIKGDDLTPREKATLTGKYPDNDQGQKWKEEDELKHKLQCDQISREYSFIEKSKESIRKLAKITLIFKSIVL
ncbi:MAG: hypothetical protein HRU35_07420 [Rickettsiaceae bacterium]|nr:hypothetical protein [Rickettsiaceae bacterium]